MKRVLEIFNNKFALMVSIPKNTPEMAKAAEEGGADAIKTHLNVHHYASGTHFGNWDEEKGNIKKIIESVKIPVGLLPGADSIATKEEILEARDAGVEFLDSFAHNMPVYIWEIEKLGRMLAVNRDYSVQNIKSLENLGMDMLEATVLPQAEYGQPLNMRDLALYSFLAESTKAPLIIPTQKKIRPEEVHWLKKAGAAGIVIGAVVTGRESAEEVYKVTKAFSDEIGKI